MHILSSERLQKLYRSVSNELEQLEVHDRNIQDELNFMLNGAPHQKTSIEDFQQQLKMLLPKIKDSKLNSSIV